MTELENIKNYHRPSYGGIFFILRKRGTFRKWPFISSVALSLVFCIILGLVRPLESYHILQISSDLIISVFPNLLGFSLGGYAIVVGFSNADLLKENARVDKYSIYQLLSSIFSISILFQIFTTVLCFFITLGIKIDIVSITKIYIPIFAIVFNLTLLFLLVFGAVYSLLLTPYIVTNLFSLSQINSLFFTLQKLNEKNNKSNGNSDEQGPQQPTA